MYACRAAICACPQGKARILTEGKLRTVGCGGIFVIICKELNMMKKGIALIVLIAVAGQSLFCVDLRLGGQPGKSAGEARYDEARESARLNRSLARLMPMAELPAPPPPIVEAPPIVQQPVPQPAPQPDPSSEERTTGLDRGLWITGLCFIVLGGLVAFGGGINFFLAGEDQEMSDMGGALFFSGLGAAGLGGILIAVSY
jgi:hypothetical protein